MTMFERIILAAGDVAADLTLFCVAALSVIVLFSLGGKSNV
jgi:hypothetical protein